MKLQVYQIDAWRDCEGGWTYNNWFPLRIIEVEKPTPRHILKKMREERYVLDKNIYRVDSTFDYDGTWTIMQKNTYEPLFDLKEIKD